MITAADQAKCSGEAALSENDFALDFDDLSLDLPFSNRDTFDAETRRIGRPRGFLRRDHYSAQQKHQKSAVGAGEKRKPRFHYCIFSRFSGLFYIFLIDAYIEFAAKYALLQNF